MINIGLVGSGYAAQLHCSGYKKVGGIQVRIKTVCDIDERRPGRWPKILISGWPARTLRKFFACETVKVIYAAYWSAEEGRRIDL